MTQSNLHSITLLSVILTLGFYSIAAPPQEVPGETLARIEKLSEVFATPNENHVFLERLAGEWETSTSVMGLPEEKGTASYKMIFGNRFLDGNYIGTIANVLYAKFKAGIGETQPASIII